MSCNVYEKFLRCIGIKVFKNGEKNSTDHNIFDGKHFCDYTKEELIFKSEEN